MKGVDKSKNYVTLLLCNLFHLERSIQYIVTELVGSLQVEICVNRT